MEKVFFIVLFWLLLSSGAAFLQQAIDNKKAGALLYRL